MDELIYKLEELVCDRIKDTDDAMLVCDAINAINALSKPRWIPVTERLPENDGFTLIFTEHGNPGVCYFTCGWWGGYGMDGITHWMPLPEPPEEG